MKSVKELIQRLITRNTREEFMTSLDKLWEIYRKQHQCMMTKQNRNVTITTRRQSNFRPRGGTYVRLIMLEINKHDG